MTLAIFPELEGLDWDTLKRPEFKTQVFEAMSGNELRYATRQFPKYTFKMSFNYLIENRDEQQLKALMGFFLQRKGMANAFLFKDPNDNAVINDVAIAVDNAFTHYQLQRTYGGFVEPVQNPKEIGAVYKNGLLMTEGDSYFYGYHVLADGVIQFNSALQSTDVVTWTGSYYYRVRFLDDGYDFTQLMRDLHDCKEMSFIGSVRNVV